ncbi:MAG: glycine--tRNA ligase [bacterium]|nr:glycine--tRNA ligase [bacterium]
MHANDSNLMEKIVALCKRRGFIFPGSEIYGGLAGFYDFGPLGVTLRNNIRREWWWRFVEQRDDMFGVESAILMRQEVWEASGHVGGGFADFLVECKKCHQRFRPDKLAGADFETKRVGTSWESSFSPGKAKCENCGAQDFTRPHRFNLMFRTHAGPVEEFSNQVYLRPETAQGMFVNFKNVLDSMHPKLPFGIAQIGKAFRNEITPGNFIFRLRELEQMEVEYFIRPEEWEDRFEAWRAAMQSWAEDIGLGRLHEREVAAEERAHYSRRTIDFDFDFPFGREELYGLAYRTDFDLRAHAGASGASLTYFNEETKEHVTPHVIEPTFGVDRTLLALLVRAYVEEEGRTLLRFPPRLAPIKIAVFPLLGNKPQLIERARAVYGELKPHFATAWDDRGNIGKRYWSQDEIGTPWCVTVDFQTLEDGTVTVRDRDTMRQERQPAAELVSYFQQNLV